MDKLSFKDAVNSSPDLVGENIAKLKELFPEVISDGRIDFDALSEILGKTGEIPEESYGLKWAGKAQSRREAHKPSTGTLRPVKADSVDWDTTQNLYIEGDNLEVLKLLQKSYAGKVKMIYIDPPYNTGNDFVYKDDYADNLKQYQRMTGQLNDDGHLLSTNSETDGRRHSNWLNMLYPRLRLARNLLTDDGVIFVSIGVEELSNLKAILNELFGEDNFIEVFSWVKTSTAPALSTKSRKTNEYILCFERNRSSARYNGEALDGGDQPLLNSGNTVRELIFPKNSLYFREDKFADGLLLNGVYDRVRLKNDLELNVGYANTDVVLEGEFKWSQAFLDEELAKGTTFIIKSHRLSVRFLRNEEGFKRPANFIQQRIISPVLNKTENGIATNESASAALSKLMGGIYFDYPKPVSLIRYLINFVCSDTDLILDFFSGSATTAHAVLQLNAEDGGKRRFIQVQLPELLPEKSAAFQAGFATIAEIGKERIRRAARQIADEFPATAPGIDLGFKVFQLDSSNLKAWDGDPDNLEQSLFDAVNPVKIGRSETDVVYEILLKYGLDPALPVEEQTLNGQRIFLSQRNNEALFFCLSAHITIETVEAIARWKQALNPSKCRVVFNDSGFTDVEKTNAVQTLKRFGITEVKSI